MSQPQSDWDFVINLADRHHERSGHTFLRSDTLTCPSHGGYPVRLWQDAEGKTLGDKCPECRREEDQRKSEEEAAQRIADSQRAGMEKRFGRAEIPFRFQDRTLENYQVTEGEKQRAIHEFCVNYAANFKAALQTGASIIFSGGVGTGKTHLSIGIASHVIRAGFSARYATVSGCVRRVRASWRSETETEQDALALFSVPDLLVLDEVGLQSGSDNEHQILFEILNSRYEQCQPSILITNLPLRDDSRDGVVVAKGLQSYIGDRLLDRLREGGGKAFTMDWKSGRAGR
jgi:DNA replication protein DnaC